LRDMKKSFIILMAFVYGVFSLGLNVQVHYCGGHFSGIDLFQISHENCNTSQAGSCCATDNCCCTFKNIYLSLDDDHSPSFGQVLFHPFEFAFKNEVFISIQNTGISARDEYILDNKAPPDIPLFLKYQSLTYYG
jgi:hypothetical protein